MKKIIVVLIFTSLNLICFGQGGMNFSIKGGGGYSTFLNGNWHSGFGFENENIIGTGFGAEIGWNSHHAPIGFTFGVWMNSNEHKHKVLGFPIPDIYIVHYKYESVSFPLLLRIRPTGNSKTREFELGGPYAEIGARFRSSQSMTVVSSFYLNESEPQDELENFNKSGIDLVAGVGYHQFGTTKFALAHGLRATYALSDMQKNPDYTPFPGDEYGSYNGMFVEYKSTHLFTVEYVLTLTLKIPSRYIGRR